MIYIVFFTKFHVSCVPLFLPLLTSDFLDSRIMSNFMNFTLLFRGFHASRFIVCWITWVSRFFFVNFMNFTVFSAEFHECHECHASCSWISWISRFLCWISWISRFFFVNCMKFTFLCWISWISRFSFSAEFHEIHAEFHKIHVFFAEFHESAHTALAVKACLLGGKTATLNAQWHLLI